MHAFLFTLIDGLSIVAAIALTLIAAALVMVASAEPKAAQSEDVFGFESLQSAPAASLPAVQRYAARDGEPLAFRFYDSTASQVLIFVHGSSYHGASYHALAAHLSQRGIARVVLPNLRGHYLSGTRRGDVDYLGQFEDDLADLITHLRNRGESGPIVLGGHSSGGGLVIRFAGGAHAALVARFLALSPAIAGSRSLKADSGWASLHLRRIIGLALLNLFGVRGFNALPVIAFNKPARFRDGTETLAYSYRLNGAYHPRGRYDRDVAKLGAQAAVLVGANDEAIDATLLGELIARASPHTYFAVLPDIDHFGVFTREPAMAAVAAWLDTPPDDDGGTQRVAASSAIVV
ncbi:alpha/beta fold hydrolase [Paraburkholderia sp.]|uniref:alpha/beta hydrolase n=1 Tax=Paraburkholderia sp. TaxID=1926495 RepID=UPI00286EB920|nr:alpha/beta fold hydrolase [Paraburkholderia sp.]